MVDGGCYPGLIGQWRDDVWAIAWNSILSSGDFEGYGVCHFLIWGEDRSDRVHVPSKGAELGRYADFFNKWVFRSFVVSDVPRRNLVEHGENIAD